MNVIWLFLAGVIGGALGGMGFGGGTALIPILTFCFCFSPKSAAWLNLIAFLPAATVAVIVHSRDRSVDWGKALYMLVFAFVGVIVAFTCGNKLSDGMAKKVFGWFLILFGVLSFFHVLFGFFKKKD